MVLGTKGGFADERASLKATLENCLFPEEIRNFINAEKPRKEFFTTKAEWQSIASQNIFNENPKTDQDLISSAALRIYEIRCKIVHMKLADTDNQEDLLLPFSKEAQKLHFDIELIRYAARQVIIASGRHLNLD